MARPQHERIDALPQQQVVSRPVSGNVVASPVDNYQAPSVSDNTLLQLAGGLSNLNPGLTKYLDSRQAEVNADQTAQGMKQGLAENGAPPVLTAEQNPFFQQGYMKMHGIVAGQNSSVEMTKAYEAQKNTPGFNPESFIQEHLKKDIAGMTDKDALAGYMESSLAAQKAIKSDFAKVQLDAVRSKSGEMLMASANNIVSAPLSAEALRGEYDNLLKQGAALNRTKPEVAQMFASALINASSGGNPDILKVAKIRGADGISLMDNKELAHSLITAEAHAVAVQKKKMAEAMVTPNMLASTQFTATLEANPMAFGDPVKWVRDNFSPTGFINSAEKSSEVLTKIIHAQKKFKDDAVAEANATGPLARAFLSDPDVKKYHDKQDTALWNSIKPNDPASLRDIVNRAVQYHEKTGYASEHLTALMRHVDTSGLPDAKGSPPVDFMLAVNAYQHLRESTNPTLAHSLTTEDTRAVMGEFIDQTRLNATQKDAFLAAKKINTPEAKELVKFVMTQQIEMKLRQDAKDLFSTTLIPNAWGGETGRNIERQQQEYTNTFRSYIAKGTSVDSAMKRTKEDMKSRYVWDGHDNYVEVPTSLGEKDRFAKATEGYLKEFKVANEGKVGPFRMDMVQGGAAYRVFDSLGNPLAQVETKDIMEGQLKRDHSTPELVQQAQALSQRIRSNSITQQEAGALYPEAQRMYKLGQITGKEVYHVRNLMAKEVNDSAARGSQLITDYVKGTSNLLSNSDLTKGTDALDLGAPIKQSGGTAKNSMAYARDFLASDPAAALTVAAEGIALRLGPDNKGRVIGLGYNVDMRSKEQVRKDFVRAGIVESSIDDVLAGKREITPDQALRLYKVVAPEYEALAKTAVGENAWAVLPTHVRAVMSDLAYNTGNPAQFKRVIAAIHEGDFKKAADNLTLVYMQDGKTISNTRRISLLRAMMAGPAMFNTTLDTVDRVSPKG